MTTTAFALTDHREQLFAFAIDGAKSSAQTTLTKFSVRFATDPAYALSWSADVFQAAARMKITREIEAWMQPGEADASFSARLAVVADELRREVLRRAKHPEHSTSMPSNEMALAENAARAEWLETIEKLQAR
jgi:hypothetical protein